MASNFDNSRQRREFSNVFLNNTQLSGIQSCSLDFNDVLVPIKSLGMADPAVYPLGARNGQCSVNYINFNNDPFLPYATGSNGFNLFLLKSKNETGENYSLTSGYINSYSTKCSVNSIPDTTVGISV